MAIWICDGISDEPKHHLLEGQAAMQESKFWRIVAVVICAGLFYVGHGLHDRGGDGLPSLANVAHAGGVAVYNSRGALNAYRLYTTDETGTLLHLWTTENTGPPKYVGVAQKTGPFLEAPKAVEKAAH
jgi:anti-sigma-K factor RskA